MALNVIQKYPGTQGGTAQLYASDTRLSLRRREQVFTRLSKSYKFVIKLFVFRHQRDQQLYIHLALHLLCLLISSRQCRSHRRLDFFYSNTNNLVQLEDTAITTERCCSMQCTERTRAMHHIIDFYLYFKSNIVFGVIIDNQISLRDSFPEYNMVTVGNSGAIWTGAGGLTISRSRRPFRTAYLRFILIELRYSLRSDRYARAAARTSASFYLRGLSTACTTMQI